MYIHYRHFKPCSRYLKGCSASPGVNQGWEYMEREKILQCISISARFEFSQLLVPVASTHWCAGCRIDPPTPWLAVGCLLTVLPNQVGFQMQAQPKIFHWTNVTIPFYIRNEGLRN
jgi:hypothetical protein